MIEQLDQIFTLLMSHKFSLENEKDLQVEIENIFNKWGVKNQREVRLSDKDIIDFMVGDIGLEIKLGGQAKRIYRQMQRYCAHDKIKAIVLITNKSMGLPREIDSKPTYILNLGRAHL